MKSPSLERPLCQREFRAQLNTWHTLGLWESSWMWGSSSAGGQQLCASCPQGQLPPLLRAFYCLTLQSSESSRASCWPSVLLAAPEASGLAKAGKCQCNLQCSFSTLNFEADTLLRTQRLSLRLEDMSYIYKLSPLLGTLEDILNTGKSLLACHQDWTLDKQEATAFWPSLPGQACIWHMPWKLRVHTEHSWLETSCLKMPDIVKYIELNFLTLEGWKAESALLGFTALRSPDIWNLSHAPNRKGRAIWIVF